uniref:Uncharacterized protein n=1 Tax=Salix viminalis TaxID=40686 RepID=A0A6N2KM09_SALVM
MVDCCEGNKKKRCRKRYVGADEKGTLMARERKRELVAVRSGGLRWSVVVKENKKKGRQWLEEEQHMITQSQTQSLELKAPYAGTLSLAIVDTRRKCCTASIICEIINR